MSARWRCRAGQRDEWASLLAKAEALTFACYKNLGVYCAIAMTVWVEHETDRIRLCRVVSTVDSGQVIHPSGIRYQIEGAIPTTRQKQESL